MKIGIYESKSWYLFGIKHQHETPETPFEELHHSTVSQAIHAFTIHTCIGYFLRYVVYFYRFYVLFAMYHPLLCLAKAFRLGHPLRNRIFPQ
jgi:hypothetical protein